MRWKHIVKFSLLFVLFASWAMMAGQPAWGPAAPVISSVSPNPTFAGDTITVVGTGFGATQGTSTLLYDGTALAITSWSATQIVAVLPSPKAVATYNTQVVVAGTGSNLLQHSIDMDIPPGEMAPIENLL